MTFDNQQHFNSDLLLMLFPFLIVLYEVRVITAVNSSFQYLKLVGNAVNDLPMESLGLLFQLYYEVVLIQKIPTLIKKYVTDFFLHEGKRNKFEGNEEKAANTLQTLRFYVLKIGHSRVPLRCLCFFKNESNCETILMKMTLICMKMKLHAEVIFT